MIAGELVRAAVDAARQQDERRTKYRRLLERSDQIVAALEALNLAECKRVPSGLRSTLCEFASQIVDMPADKIASQVGRTQAALDYMFAEVQAALLESCVYERGMYADVLTDEEADCDE